MTKFLIIRHAETDQNRFNRTLFGKGGAPINAHGMEQVKELQAALEARGIDLQTEPVAISEMLRTQQTAQGAGLQKIVINPCSTKLIPPIQNRRLA